MDNEIISEREDRIKKLRELREIGIDPYPSKSNRTHNIIEVLNDFEKLEKNEKEIIIAGRIMSKRDHGNLFFGKLKDESGEIQFLISKKEVGEEKFKIFKKLIDVADFIEISGKCFLTKKEEKSILSNNFNILSKAIRPLPEKWHGLKDKEEILRKRYLDILLNEETKDMVYKRAKFWDSVRKFLTDKGFLEVETPVLETIAGGATAKPFITHHNALDIDVYLRIAIELWQKKLIVGGLEKTYEIGRVFRNEGMDAEHLQDYIQMELFWAYANYEDGMKLVEEMYQFVAKETFGTLKFKIKGFDIDLGKKWEKYDFRETIKKFTDIDISKANVKEMKNKLDKLDVEYEEEGFNVIRAIDSLWKYCRKKISGPGFLINVPVEIEPLAKRDEKNRNIVQRFQPIIAGSELGKGYSELNDPIDQAERFKKQQELREKGDEEAQMYDKSFVEALEHGMPPVCGFGMTERTFSFLMDKPMRETQIFPLMKERD